MSMQNAKFKHKEHLYITIKLFSFKQLLCEVTCSKDESLKFMKQQHILLSSVKCPGPEAPKRDNKCPHDDDDITEVPDEDKPAEPPKKKKKNKGSKETAPSRKDRDDGAGPSTSMVEPENVGDEATPIPTSTEVPAEETKAPKKKKKQKKDANLRSFG